MRNRTCHGACRGPPRSPRLNGPGKGEPRANRRGIGRSVRGPRTASVLGLQLPGGWSLLRWNRHHSQCQDVAGSRLRLARPSASGQRHRCRAVGVFQLPTACHSLRSTVLISHSRLPLTTNIIEERRAARDAQLRPCQEMTHATVPAQNHHSRETMMPTAAQP